MQNTRTVDVFLPPGYYAAPDRSYKVLYANDGQDMALLRMKKTLEVLYAGNKIERIIVVAVHATRHRVKEYGTAGIPNAQGLGARAGQYSKLLTDQVMPYINRHYRTLEGPTNTAIMGSSLGGISAFDIAWNHPLLFGKVGVFSGSFWWRTRDRSRAAKQDSRIIHRIVRGSDKREGLKMWFEAGTKDETDDRDGNGVIDAIQDTTELMDALELRGYRKRVDMVYVEVKGGRHDQATWAKALPRFLRWAFPVRKSQRVKIRSKTAK